LPHIIRDSETPYKNFAVILLSGICKVGGAILGLTDVKDFDAIMGEIVMATGDHDCRHSQSLAAV
jgi:hypothetical protein